MNLIDIPQQRYYQHATPVYLERRRLRVIRLSPAFIAGFLIVVVLTGTALFAETIAPFDVAMINPAERLATPSFPHWFGTDLFGRDLFSRVIVGSRINFEVTLIALFIGAVPGVLLGILTGMQPGFVSSGVVFAMDTLLALPGLLVVIALAAAFGRTPHILAIAIGIVSVPSFFRQTRTETLKINGLLFVHACHAMGAGKTHVILWHILPGILPTLIVIAMIRAGGILLSISAFSFLGLGAQPPTPEWGALLADGRDYMDSAWWLMVFPGAAISITILGLNLLGDGLRDMLDVNTMR